MKKYYTYAYLREDGAPYYIGKGQGRRVYSKQKLSRAPKDKSRIIYLKQNLTEAEAFRHEIYMIAVYGRKDLETGILHNRTNGGDGVSGYIHSEEVKIRMSKVAQNRSEEAKQKLIDILTSDDRRKLMSEKMKKNKNKAYKWKITFDDGRVVEQFGISEWCKENGYSKQNLSLVKNGKRNRHKDIISVEILI